VFRNCLENVHLIGLLFNVNNVLFASTGFFLYSDYLKRFLRYSHYSVITHLGPE